MKKIKKPFLLLSWSVVLLWIVYIFLLYYFFLLPKNKVCYNTNCFAVEIADSAKERALWLMFRKQLWMNEWMLFVYREEALHSFWMKNTLIPLDLLWFDSNFTVIEKTTLYPCGNDICLSYDSHYNSKYVLEINAWISDKLSIITWSIFSFDI